jgi:hypothetical protein
MTFISAQSGYRWSNTSTCSNTIYEPDGVYDEIGTGLNCVNQDINLSGFSFNGTFNVSFVYVFNISVVLSDDKVDLNYCYDSYNCALSSNLHEYDNLDTPVDFLTTYDEYPMGILNYTQLQNLRLEIDYKKIAVKDSDSFVDSMGIYITCIENWIANYTPCNISDNRTKYYYDSNNCGTNTTLPGDNGSIEYCDYCVQTWDCQNFTGSCGTGVSQINCSFVNYTDFDCCNDTGLPTDCDYLSIGNYSDFDLYCGDIDVTLIVPTYPYVDFNTTYPMALIVTQDNVTFNLSEFDINITLPNGTTNTYNMTWDSVDEQYEIEFIFTEIGDYPFIIFAEYPYDNIPSISGTLIVRVPCYITFEGYETKDQDVTKYDNDFAYIIAEKTEKMYYDQMLETFIVPLFFTRAYNTSVFHAPYEDGSATLKLWDNETNYAVRLIDGQINFPGQYSVPNVSDSYDTNIYIGKFYWNCSQNETIRVFLAEKDIHQYRWLFNWGFIILLVVIIFTSIVLFFVIPEYSQISIIFGLGFTLMLIAFRVFFFVWKGW